jgi:hypothetical protein
VPRFLPVLVDGRVHTGHDEIVLTVPSPGDGCEILGQDEIVQMASKKQGTSASAGSPIDFVSAAGSVRVPQDLISWLNFSLIDLGAIMKLSGLRKPIN